MFTVVAKVALISEYLAAYWSPDASADALAEYLYYKRCWFDIIFVASSVG